MSNFDKFLEILEERDTNKAHACISSSVPGGTVHFKNKEDKAAWDVEYKALVDKYNKLYHK